MSQPAGQDSMTMAMLIGAALACFAANLCVLDWRRNG